MLSFRRTLILAVAAFIASTYSVRSYADLHNRTSYCTFNESNLTWKIGNELVSRTVHFDKQAGSLRTTEISNGPKRAILSDVAPSDAEISLVDTDSNSRTISLESDWEFAWQLVGRPAHGGRLLTIHLQGVRKNSGFEMETLYEVWGKELPYMAKTVILINRKEKPVLVTGSTLDRWVVQIIPLIGPILRNGPPPSRKPATFLGGKDGFGSLVQFQAGEGVTAAVSVPSGTVELENGAMVVRTPVSIEVKHDNGRATLPTSVIYAWTGPTPTGQLLLDKFKGLGIQDKH